MTNLLAFIAVTHRVVGMRAGCDVYGGSAVCDFDSGVVVRLSTRVFRVIDVLRLSVDESDHAVLPITNMVTVMFAKNSEIHD